MCIEVRNRKVGACGNYCGGCNDYLVYTKDNNELRIKVASDIQEQMNIKVPLEEIGCQGCWGDIHNAWAASLECKIRQCVEKKRFATCASCRDFPCDTFEKQFNKDSEPHKNINKIKEVGIDVWLAGMEASF